MCGEELALTAAVTGGAVETIVSPPLCLVLVWSGETVERIALQGNRSQDRAAGQLSGPAEAMRLSLNRYVHGLEPFWPELPLNWGRCSAFARLVLETLHREVGFGQWISYSGLAERCGRPKAARAVGRVMSRNPWPLIVPCHRVLAKDRSLGGFSSGLEWKRYLLRLEGI